MGMGTVNIRTLSRDVAAVILREICDIRNDTFAVSLTRQKVASDGKYSDGTQAFLGAADRLISGAGYIVKPTATGRTVSREI